LPVGIGVKQLQRPEPAVYTHKTSEALTKAAPVSWLCSWRH